MPFVRAEAYQRRFFFLSHVVLPRGLVSFSGDLPPDDIPLIALVTNLAARDGLHPALTSLLLSAARDVHGQGDELAKRKQFPSPDNVVLPMNEDAQRFFNQGPPFLQRYLPFWLAIAIDRLVVMLIPLLTLLYPLFKILPPTYRWQVRSRIFRYYRNLRAIETMLDGDVDKANLAQCRTWLNEIEEKLSALSVPIAHAETLYNMRLHLKLVQERLDTLSTQTEDPEPPA